MYKKSILLVQNKRLEKFIKQLLHRKEKDLETSLPLLSDINALKNELQRNKNTINLRGEFGYFVKEHGLPFIMIIDYQVDFGLSIFEDPDKRKLVRTFLLSFTLLANAKGFQNASANIVFVINKNQASTMSQFSKYPSFLLEQIRTKDDRVNKIIDSFSADRNKVKSFFKISYIFKPEEGKYAAELERLEKIIDIYDKIADEKLKMMVDKPKTEMVSEDMEPANVICRAAMEKLIINGELGPLSADAKDQYIEKNIHIEGAVTTKTLTVVKDRLLSTFQSMVKINPFKKNEKIFINIPDTSVIDGSFASIMGSFLSSALSEYKGISINMGKENSGKLKNSDGYIAIKDYVLKNL